MVPGAPMIGEEADACLPNSLRPHRIYHREPHCRLLVRLTAATKILPRILDLDPVLTTSPAVPSLFLPLALQRGAPLGISPILHRVADGREHEDSPAVESEKVADAWL